MYQSTHSKTRIELYPSISDSKQLSCNVLCGSSEHRLPRRPLLHRYFEEAVQQNTSAAKRTGLRYRDEFMPYDVVSSRSSAAAEVLLQRVSKRSDDQREMVVAVDMQPCNELIVVLLAILKIGAAYVPVDSHSAINRVRYILNEVQPLCILADFESVFTTDIDTVWSRFCIINVDELLRNNANSQCQLSKCKLSVNCNDQAVVVYTSGSTGRPKGVRLSHRSIMNRLTWQWRAFPFNADGEVGCFKTSLLFVDSIIEIFSCTLRLVPLVVVGKNVTTNPEAFVNLLAEHRVSRVTMVASLLRNLLFYLAVSEDGTVRLPELRLWISNSETLQTSLVQKFFSVFPAAKSLVNLYGSTETTADVTCEVFSSLEDIDAKTQDNRLSIGKPMDNCNVYLLDDSLNLVEGDGTIGEICVSGLNVANGYIGDVSEDNCSFIANPFSDDNDHRVLYRTGDYGRISEGCIIYEGRHDVQVKIRGQRVNISEIERAVGSCVGVDKVVVLCHQFSQTSNVIVAYYTTLDSAPRRIESSLADACRHSLPAYMRPKLIPLSDMPVQSHTGKVDRVALRRLYEKTVRRQSSEELASCDERGRRAANIIALNLNIPASALSRRMSFFELGGDSVSMVATLVQLMAYGLHIPIEFFSRATTVQEIIDAVCDTPSTPIVRTLQEPVYFVRSLADIDNDTSAVIVDILASSFADKEPLDVLLGVTESELRTFAQSLYSEAQQPHARQYSLVVVERDSGRVVGGDFLFDYFSGVSVRHHASMAPILCLLKRFEEPVKRRLAETVSGRLLFNFCLCIDKNLAHAQQVELCHLIEANVLQVAEKHGFCGVVTNNTNPVTQDICEHFYDYRLLSQFLVRDFDFNGRKVFAHAPENYYIKMMIKYILPEDDNHDDVI